MITFILILLLLAAIFGVLGVVLKIALILVLAAVLAIVLLVWIAWAWFRGRVRAFERELDRQSRRDRAVDVHHVENTAERDHRELGP